ncbi:quinolinate synthase NadA [Paradesulfitobacterium aromaticivorans]
MRQVLPPEYLDLGTEELEHRIQQAKAALRKRLVILGHHYQKDEVIRFADYRGDSLKLSQLAAREREAEYIIFLGVHFMAETADILTTAEQKVLLPDLAAGCSMADMADIDEVEECWDVIKGKYPDQEIIPITYVNSTAEIKAFCGRKGGMTCTSSNARAVFEKVMGEDKIILFLPDEHLGRNTGLECGIEAEEIFLWERREQDRGDQLEDRDMRAQELPVIAPRLILWNGFCSVHQRFTLEQINKVRSQYPDIKVIVHPECEHTVVAHSDLHGSTEYIIETVTRAPAGSSWAVGTEINLVHRLAQENPDKKIVCLNETVCMCMSMNRIHQPHLLWTLENLVQGKVVNQIRVPSEIAAEAKLALERMKHST